MSNGQVLPPSVTGKGAFYAGSVHDHRFGTSAPFTLGVEEEYMLLDAESFDLVQHIDTVLAAVHGHPLEAQINAELMQSVLEIATPVCRTAGDVRRELLTLRELHRRRRRTRTACASARRERTRSASSSGSGSRPATATAPSSTSSSTSRGAS